MTLLIKGMDMPKSCAECELCDNLGMCIPLGEDLFEYLSKEIAKAEPVRFFPDNWKCNDCPLVEVPTPHGRLIDEDAVNHEYYKSPSYLNLCNAINDAPTVIEAEEG